MSGVVLQPSVIGESGKSCLSLLESLNPATFSYMTARQREVLRQQLVKAIYLLRCGAQEQLHRKKFVKLKTSCSQIELGLSLLSELDKHEGSEAAAREEQRSSDVAAGQSPLRYVGLAIQRDLTKGSEDKNGQFKSVDAFLEDARAFISGLKKITETEADPKKRLKLEETTVPLRREVGAFNDIRRLWWVCGTSMYSTLFEVLADQNTTLPYQSNVSKVTGSISYTMGMISWTLYFFRLFAVDFNEAVQAAVSDYRPEGIPDTYKLHEKTRWRLFADEVCERKFIMLNDLYWGATNALTFFWLRGPLTTTLGQAGSILNLAMLVVDFLVVVWRFIEAYRDYKAKKAKIEAEEQALLAQDSNIIGEEADFLKGKALIAENDTNKLAAIARLQEIKRASAALDANWEVDKAKLCTDTAYTISLVIGFATMCSFFIPGLTGSLIIALSGAVFYFMASVVNNIVYALIDRSRSLKNMQAYHQEASDFLERFNASKDPNERKLCLLEIKRCLARSAHEKEWYDFYLKKAALKGFVDGSMPVAVFFSFAFLPMGPGFALVAVSIMLALAVHAWIQSLEPATKIDRANIRFFPVAKNAQGGDDKAIQDQINSFDPRTDVTLQEIDPTLEALLPAPAAK